MLFRSVLLFFDAVLHHERTGVVTAYNLGLAVATLAGAATGGLLLRSLGENRTAYFTVFAVSSLLRLATIPLLRRVRVVKEQEDQPDGNRDSWARLSRNVRARP